MYTTLIRNFVGKQSAAELWSVVGAGVLSGFVLRTSWVCTAFWMNWFWFLRHAKIENSCPASVVLLVIKRCRGKGKVNRGCVLINWIYGISRNYYTGRHREICGKSNLKSWNAVNKMCLWSTSWYFDTSRGSIYFAKSAKQCNHFYSDLGCHSQL